MSRVLSFSAFGFSSRWILFVWSACCFVSLKISFPAKLLVPLCSFFFFPTSVFLTLSDLSCLCSSQRSRRSRCNRWPMRCLLFILRPKPSHTSLLRYTSSRLLHIANCHCSNLTNCLAKLFPEFFLDELTFFFFFLFCLCTNVKVDANGDTDPGVLMSAQTITSENNSTTTTTQITKVSEVSQGMWS